MPKAKHFKAGIFVQSKPVAELASLAQLLASAVVNLPSSGCATFSHPMGEGIYLLDI